MKNIIYCSNAYEEIFNNNTRSNFNSYIDIHHIEYLHDGEITLIRVVYYYVYCLFVTVFCIIEMFVELGF